MTEKDAAKYPHIIRHIKTLAANFPVFDEYFGKIVFAEHPFTPKPIKPQKEEKKENKKEEQIDDEPKAEPKKEIKYTYKMNLDAWKRHYKNLNWDTEDWQDYFYKEFDGQDQSLWLLVYKDPADFKVDW